MIALLLGLAMLVLSACGTTSPSASTSPSGPAGVHGYAMIEGGLPSSQDPRPMPGVTVSVLAGGIDGTVVTKTKADTHGAFTFDLVPGTYTLVEGSDVSTAQTITVEPGTFFNVSLTIQAF
jgi:hypothetical protein